MESRHGKGHVMNNRLLEDERDLSLEEVRKLSDLDLEEARKLIDPEVEEVLPEAPDISNSMDLYLHQIGKGPLLKFNEEQALAKSARGGDEKAKWELVERNLKLVVSVAKVYSRSGVPLPDLIQEGNLGLIKAVKDFDPDKGYRFSTYAVAWIRQAITRAIERQGRVIRVPSYVVQAIRKLNKAFVELQNENQGIAPTIEELSARAKFPEEKVILFLGASEAVASLDEDGPAEDDERSLLETLADTEAETPETAFLLAESSEVLKGMMSWLSPQEKMIIEKRFGLQNGVTSTLQEIGQQLHITRERVRQLEARALKKLRLAVTRKWLENYFEAA